MKNNIEKTVSIIIPSRNIDYLLELCIEKIRELYKEVKIFLVLNEINKTINDKNIEIIKTDKLFMSAMRNLGAKKATTKYIAFIDSDAYPAENWLESAVAFLENNKDYAVATGMQLNPPTDNFQQICVRKVRYNHLFTHKEWKILVDENAKEQDCTEFSTANAVISIKTYNKLKGLNDNIYIGEDNEFSNRLVDNGYKIRFIPETKIYHRECNIFSYLRKMYCMACCYSNALVINKKTKTKTQTFINLMPAVAFLMFIIAYFFSNFNIICLCFPFIAFLILFIEAIKEAKKFKKKKLKAFGVILFIFCTFCFVWIIGTIWGLFNYSAENIQKKYRHY